MGFWGFWIEDVLNEGLEGEKNAVGKAWEKLELFDEKIVLLKFYMLFHP